MKTGVMYQPINGKEEGNGGGMGMESDDLESALPISKQQQRFRLPLPQKQQRLVSLDVFRGLTVAVIYFLFPFFLFLFF